MPAPTLPAFATLDMAALAALASKDRLPPVERWNPPHCGDSNMVIRSDGSWWHEGRPIARSELVRLFSRILRREPDGSHVLVTPVEKLSITVEAAPFVAVELMSEGSGASRRLAFRLGTDDIVFADRDHAIAMRGSSADPRPMLHVRGGLEALIARPVFYELAALALDGGAEPAGIWSNGAFFLLEPA